MMEHRQTPCALRRHEVSRPREQQISGWFLLATSGTPEWEEPLGLCCSQAHFLLASPLRFSRPLPPFSLPCSLRPALVDGFAAPVSQIGRSWSFSRLLLLSTLILLSAQIQAWELLTPGGSPSRYSGRV